MNSPETLVGGEALGGAVGRLQEGLRWSSIYPIHSEVRAESKKEDARGEIKASVINSNKINIISINSAEGERASEVSFDAVFPLIF